VRELYRTSATQHPFGIRFGLSTPHHRPRRAQAVRRPALRGEARRREGSKLEDRDGAASVGRSPRARRGKRRVLAHHCTPRGGGLLFMSARVSTRPGP